MWVCVGVCGEDKRITSEFPVRRERKKELSSVGVVAVAVAVVVGG